jgi:hypothetical protein
MYSYNELESYEADAIVKRVYESKMLNDNWQKMHEIFGRGAWVLVADCKDALLTTDVEMCFFVPLRAYEHHFGAGTDLRKVRNYDTSKETFVLLHHQSLEQRKWTVEVHDHGMGYICTMPQQQRVSAENEGTQ